mmetsp:Transcript_20299/g.29145  ORF Transcript_20299/g.29145 Transcript_20299/m.29145 type:complete len:201 (+) Transcript_20299:152-754(+)|eukprot:CAMPEP_0185038120 /NCGR_PEP_ID=MMETSP1103-20130426/33379_1 /TAXON_ID=36769 /ORGANISM="Paraphysomonas bandaiensis, Strain Caron Lab Isolate" /LENGTH=200 /DNA_ID=CAMNT_0027576407 /DNA_START=76 /DNA_END=678 /DNA_ORIENTATION=-
MDQTTQSAHWGNSASSRLERAKYQYENLLLSLGNTSITEDTSDSRYEDDGNVVVDTSSHMMRSTLMAEDTWTEVEQPNCGECSWDYKADFDKDNTIISQQAEIERLRNELSVVTMKSEAAVAEATSKQEMSEKTNTERCRNCESKLAALKLENEELRAAYESTRSELESERRRLHEAINKITRLGHRKGVGSKKKTIVYM